MIRIEVLGRLPASLRVSDLKRIAAKTSPALRLSGTWNVTLSFVSEAKMRTLNRRFMGKNRPTDVLSFPVVPAKGFPSPAECELGDLFVCPAYALREAKRRSIPPREELARLIIHGILHLAGEDHATNREEARMFAKQERLVASVMNV